MNNDDLAELERLHKASFGWAMSCCGWNRSDAEDVLQSVYVKILEGRATFDGRSSFKTWLFAVIRRTALDQRRRNILRTLSQLAFLSRNGSTPQSHATDLDSLSSVLRTLPARQQEVLHLVFYQDMTIEEAARVMDISVGAARTHYHRGKQALKALLDSERRQ